MPYPGEHAARLHEPGDYERMRRENDAFGKGIDAIWGVKAGGAVELQALRFRSGEYTEKQAREWLAAHDYKPLEFEPAEPVKAAAGILDSAVLPRVVLNVCKPGHYEGLNGAFDLDDTDCEDMIRAFHEVKAMSVGAAGDGVPVVPVLKLEHKKGTAALELGVYADLWRKGEWVQGEVVLTEPEWGQRILTGQLRFSSLEADLDAQVYGKDYRAFLTATAMLPGDTRPAIPGAGVVRIAAAEGKARAHVKLIMAQEEPLEGSDSVTTEETLAAIDKKIDKMCSAVDALASSISGKIKAEEDAAADKVKAEAEAKAKADAEAKTQTEAAAKAAEGEVTKELGTLAEAGKLTLGEVDHWKPLLVAMAPEARKSVLAGLAKHEPVKTGKPQSVSGAAAQTIPTDPKARVALGRKIYGECLAEAKGDHVAAAAAMFVKAPELMASAAEGK